MTLRPDTVVNAIKDYYELNPGCGGRSVHRYATKVTRHMSIARNKLAELFNTPSVDEVIFTKNATHSLNQVAKGLQWEKGDVILTTDREHNSNLVLLGSNSNKNKVSIIKLLPVMLTTRLI